MANPPISGIQEDCIRTMKRRQENMPKNMPKKYAKKYAKI